MHERILVIDNNESMRDWFALCLKGEGWEPFTYAYAQIDLAMLQQHPPDLIIIDFNLQEGGIGWELLQLLKMEETTANIPILITTSAFQLSLEIENYLLTRYIRVVQKPFDLSTFAAIVQQTLTLASQAGTIFSNDHTLPILVVDDAEDLRETLTMILRLEGYQVATAHNGRVALDMASRNEHCLILLDIAMPIMNGFEFLSAYNRQLRPHSPVIILSGETDVQSRVLPTFVVGILSKPFEVTHLLTLVAKYAQHI